MKFSTVWDCDYWMKSNGFYAGLNMPDALVSHVDKNKNEEFSHELPPYAKRKHFLVDEFPACPTNWMKSEGKLTSYFVPVKENKGMWLDFNKNFENDYHVAIVVSVQGVNPITGLPCKDSALEQYIETCPKCNEKFGPHRLCTKCGYRWPKQNYICTTGTPLGMLWLDGFRSAEGIIRQYILTQEKMRGVASNLIGESRVFAIGLSFFMSKNPKPKTKYNQIIQTNNPAKSPFFSPCYPPIDLSPRTLYDFDRYSEKMDKYLENVNVIDDGLKGYNTCTTSNAEIACSTAHSSEQVTQTQLEDLRTGSKDQITQDQLGYNVPSKKTGQNFKGMSSARHIKTIKLEVGAGANINQLVYDDPEPLDFWRSEPESILCINYLLEEEALKIIKSGQISVEGDKEGYLKNIPVGNV